MQRIETLVEKLQQQLQEQADVNQLLLTVHMLQHELVHAKNASVENESTAVKVSMPFSLTVPTNIYAATQAAPEKVEEQKPVVEEKIIEILQIDEAEIEAELEEIKRNADVRQKVASQNKQHIMFDVDHEEEIPTLRHQATATKMIAREINETAVAEKPSVNDRLKESKTEVAEMLIDTPVKDMKKAIGVNDRFVFINELFRGDEVAYDRSIKTINSFDIWPEAEYWIRRELKLKLSWQDNNEIVKQFDQIVKRRFS
ncbi:MAG TPA: hypothetical protein VK559_01015 [Ferruginibacter sp.]|nr:hypothetical protein [Ferruginibacter sp.]